MALKFLNTVQVDTDVLYVDTSSDRVGIGTTSPGAKLTIGDPGGATTRSIQIEGNSSGSGMNGVIGYFGNGLYISNNYYYNSAQVHPVSTYGQTNIACITGTTTGSNFIDLSVSDHTDSNNAPDVRMRIMDSGNVGIGVTNPTEKLHMNNTTGTGCFIRFQNTGGSGVYIGGRSESMEMYTNGTIKMAIGSNGSVKFDAYNSTNQTGTPTYLLGTDASGNVVKTNSAPSPITSQAASLYDLIPNGAFTTTYAFTSTAGTYAKVMQGDDVITNTGTYTIQAFVNDNAVGGTQYSETYSGVMSWHHGSTNDTGGGTISEIVLHRSGHAANQGMIYLRTRETSSSEGSELRLEIMCNRTYSAASNVVFKFVRLI